MTLPLVSGWIIDFRTAEAIFDSGSNERIDHCVGLCQTGQMHICHQERARFRAKAALKTCFLDGHNCVCVPNQEIMSNCLALSQSPLGLKVAAGNDAALFISATAAVMGFGVLSDHRSFVFTTVYDLCTHMGVPILSAEEYFDSL